MWEIIQKGGPLMYLILTCSILALAIIIERLWYFHSVRFNREAFLKELWLKLKKEKFKEAIGFCEMSRGPIPKVLKAGILKYDQSRDEIKEAMDDASLYEVPRLEKNLSALATIAHISPLLGLLGTVTGMVNCFQTIQTKATAWHPISPADLAGGIGEALLTTMAGLMVAIPAYVAYNYLVSRLNRIVLDMESSATELINFLSGFSHSKREA